MSSSFDLNDFVLTLAGRIIQYGEKFSGGRRF